jgi:hypothetical protein
LTHPTLPFAFISQSGKWDNFLRTCCGNGGSGSDSGSGSKSGSSGGNANGGVDATAAAADCIRQKVADLRGQSKSLVAGLKDQVNNAHILVQNMHMQTHMQTHMPIQMCMGSAAAAAEGPVDIFDPQIARTWNGMSVGRSHVVCVNLCIDRLLVSATCLPPSANVFAML